MTINGNMTIKDALSYGAKMLSEIDSIDVPLLECEILLGHILNFDRIKLYLDRDRILKESEKEAFLSVLKRRIKHEPVSYITNQKEFMSLSFYVEKGVLIPRPETETLVELMIDELKNMKDISILDICTGSGSIAVSLAYYLKDSELTAIDKYDVCIKTAKINAEKYNLTDRINLIKADILNDNILDKKYDCIVSNPPYIKNETLSSLPDDVKNYEPEYALDGGDDGLIFYRKITSIAESNLKEDGLLFFEIGFEQGKDVCDILNKSGKFKNIKIIKDLAGLDRIVTAVKGA